MVDRLVGGQGLGKTWPKMDAAQLREWGFDLAGVCYCMHCDLAVSVSAVMANPRGDFCPTEGCDGGGFGVDLDPTPWWRGERTDLEA
jgi:hypothetical protein